MLRRITTLWTLVMVGLLLATGVTHAAPSSKDKDKDKGNAKVGRITWNTPTIRQDVAPGTTTTINVSFTSTSDLQNVTLRASGGLAKIITITPANVAQVKANTPINVTLTAMLPANATAGRSGVVQVRLGKRNVGQPLHVHLRVPGQDDDEDD